MGLKEATSLLEVVQIIAHEVLMIILTVSVVVLFTKSGERAMHRSPRAKLYRISEHAEPQIVVHQMASDIDGRYENASFVGRGDKEKVMQLYRKLTRKLYITEHVIRFFAAMF